MRTEYNSDERAMLWLSRVFGARLAPINRLLSEFAKPSELREAVLRGESLGFAENVTKDERELLAKSAGEGSVERYAGWLDGYGVRAVTLYSGDYPDFLREIYDPPAVLYTAGRLLRRTELPIAVIGSRKCSDYGLEMAEFFGRELARNGACVVSGMAVGCDSAASRGALSAQGADYPTIAVLGSGIGVVYPPKNKKLCLEIAERGAVISEFLPNCKPSRYSFPQRNRIISGLSRGVLVVEAGIKSGTSITVDFALDQGRDVFAIPGRITDRMSMGTNALIKRGEAKPVFEVDDILSEYGLEVSAHAASPVRPIPRDLSPRQREIYLLLASGEKTIDELCDDSGIEVAELNTLLTEMELSGIIKQLPNNLYSV